MFENLKRVIIGKEGSKERHNLEKDISESVKYGGFLVKKGVVYNTKYCKPALVLATRKDSVLTINGIEFVCEKFVLLTYEDTLELSSNNIIELSEEEFRKIVLNICE